MQRGDLTMRMRAEIGQPESPVAGAGGLDAGPSGRTAGLVTGKEIVGEVRKRGKIKGMNAFEKILFGFLATASTAAPIFVHSPQGLVILNASEQLLANVLAQFQKPQVAPVSPSA